MISGSRYSGVLRRGGARFGSLTSHDSIDCQPDTCTLPGSVSQLLATRATDILVPARRVFNQFSRTEVGHQILLECFNSSRAQQIDNSRDTC